jgi:putative molybdopterin biosynthesis protein
MVVPRERVQILADGSAQISGPVARGRHVRAEGEDFPAGALLIPAGHQLSPADLAAAAAGGHARLEVARRPAVAIIPTGDEIRPAGTPLKQGEITESNSLMLAARALEVGATPVVSEIQPDDPAAIEAEVRRWAGTAELVLVLSGSSAGRSDCTAAVICAVGRLIVHGVAVRPGHPALLGYAKSSPAPAGPADVITPVIGVPGYPLAAAVIFELFAAPLLASLQGVHPSGHDVRRAQLACDWNSDPAVEEWVPVSLTRDPADSGGVPVATPGGRGAGSLGRLTRAAAWWRVPAGEGQFTGGQAINVVPIAGPPAVREVQ